MKLQIDIPHRYACMRAHTATHLLHAELWKIFPQTKQAGSYVWPDELRFDFFAERSLTSEELQHISAEINNCIVNNYPVSVTEMSYENAINTGAKAFFEDTYPEIVRVVAIGTGLSVELCGGTHVTETSQIGSFFIIEQTAVAAGVKRIVALTGPKVATHAQNLQSNLESVAMKISVPVKQLDAKIEKILAESEEMSQKIEKLTIGIIKNLIRTPWRLSTYSCDGIFDFDKDIVSLWISFSEIVNSLRSLWQDRTWLVTTASGQYAVFHPQAKQIAQELGLKWWGSDSFVQGRDEGILWFL
jgi:alanyl-tRNA synthetase